MCGIAGLLANEGDRPIDRTLLERMTRVQAHRGPDGEGFWEGEGVALGHRRLAIVDVEGGAQPMANEDGTVVVTYNGEIYNAPDLRADLERRGHRFRTRCDTEAIVHAYEEWGDDCVDRFRGMFAFGLWDARRRRLLLARDPAGVKPLYWAERGGLLRFASEAKAILEDPAFPRAMNLEAIADYLVFQDVQGDRSFFEGVRLLPAGSMLVVEGGAARVRRYWDFPRDEADPIGADEAAGLAARLLEDSVRLHLLRSDVPVALYLSGGLDSSAVAAFGRAHATGPLRSYTCRIPEVPEVDEGRFAEVVARHVGTEHVDVRLDADEAAAGLARFVWHLDEPRTGSLHPPYAVARRAAEDVKVILAGQGGDEVFGGYPRHLLPEPPDGDWAGGGLGRPAVLSLDRLGERLLGPALRGRIDLRRPRREFHERHIEPTRGLPAARRAIWADQTFYLHGLLVAEDKLSMAHSVETRVPFVDRPLVEGLARIPAEILLLGGRTKGLLRRALAGRLPAEILDRPKQGFGTPDSAWFRGPWRLLVEDLTVGPRARARGLFDAETVRRDLLDPHLAGARRREVALWSLMQIEIWHRVFLDGDPPLS